MNIAILPLCPVLQHGTSMMGLEKQIWIYPHPIPSSFCCLSTSSAQKKTRSHGGVMIQTDTANPPQKDAQPFVFSKPGQNLVSSDSFPDDQRALFPVSKEHFALWVGVSWVQAVYHHPPQSVWVQCDRLSHYSGPVSSRPRLKSQNSSFCS